MPLTSITQLARCSDAAERLALLIRDARGGYVLQPPSSVDDPISEEEIHRVRTALASLSESERIVLLHAYGVDAPSTTPLHAIERAQGWVKGRASETRRRAIHKLHDAVYVPPLPPCGQWVQLVKDRDSHWGRVAGVRVLEHKGRYQFIGAVMVLFNEHEHYWHVIEEKRAYVSVRNYTLLPPQTALDFALRIGEDSSLLRAEVLVSLAPHLSTGLAWQASTAALAAIDALHQNQAGPLLAQLLLLPHLSPNARLTILQLLLPRIPIMGDRWEQHRVLTLILPVLSRQECDSLLTEVHHALGGRWDERQREELLATIQRIRDRARFQR